MLDRPDILALLCNQRDRKSVPNRCRSRRVSETVDATINRSDERRRFVNQAFGREIVDLDGVEFVACKFCGTTLRYSGGEVPRIVGCSFSEAQVDGPAERTLNLLKAMSLPRTGLRGIVGETFGSLFGN